VSGDPDLALRTRALHAGEDTDPVTRAVEAPLVLSTNFVADPDEVAFSATDLKEDTPYFYAAGRPPRCGRWSRNWRTLRAARMHSASPTEWRRHPGCCLAPCAAATIWC